MTRRHIPIVPVALFLSLVSAAAAAEPERLTPRHVAKLRAVSQVAASPDGRHVAYVLSVPRRRPLLDDDGPAWAELHVVGRDGPSRPFVTGEVNVGEWPGPATAGRSPTWPGGARMNTARST